MRYERDEDYEYDRWRDEHPEEWGQKYDDIVGPLSDGQWRSLRYRCLAAGAFPDEAAPKE